MFQPASAEVARLDSHFVRTLGLLHEAPTHRLTQVQRRARARHLERLELYRRQQRFPKNTRFPGRMLPHFIDEVGTRCAMGHLIEASGGRDLVQYITRERNFQRIHELADIPELVAWLDENGLRLHEAAMIQPAYCASSAQNCVCESAYFEGMVRGALVDGGASLSVEVLYGAVEGVGVGDVLPLVANPSLGPVGPGDMVFAALSDEGAQPRFLASGGDVRFDAATCYVPQQTYPEVLPLEVVHNALSAPSLQSCVNVVASYDAAWGPREPGCPKGSGGESGAQDDSGGGCSVSHDSVLGAEAVIALSAVLVVRGVRRRARR